VAHRLPHPSTPPLDALVSLDYYGSSQHYVCLPEHVCVVLCAHKAAFRPANLLSDKPQNESNK